MNSLRRLAYINIRIGKKKIPNKASRIRTWLASEGPSRIVPSHGQEKTFFSCITWQYRAFNVIASVDTAGETEKPVTDEQTNLIQAQLFHLFMQLI